MPILIREQTRCRVCGKKITETDSVMGFQSFIYNELSPLKQFSGAIMHESCFQEHPLKDKVLKIYDKIETEYERKVCCISKKVIDFSGGLHPDNHVYLGHLTDDTQSPLFEYNYLHLNKRYFEFWGKKKEFLNLLEEQANQEGWGSFFELIKLLKSPVKESVNSKVLDQFKKYLNSK